MIGRNIGNVERVFRLMFGLLLGAWFATRPGLNGMDWFVLVASLALILNGVFSRCYLWYILDINTCARNERDCSKEATTCL